MAKKRILFVDDDPNILSGLRRMLRSMRKEFTMDFAENGRSALELMAEFDFDVVVSDMRMPGMDGATLLAKIQKIHPHSIRIMLTGQADDESILRTVGVVHQFLAKPCDPETLKSVILRASALHRLITDGKLKDIVSGIDSLPSLPTVYFKLQKKLLDPDITIKDIGAIVEEDMAMSAKVLQLVNSAFFGLFQKVDSPARAVNLLGLDTIRSLAVGVEVFSQMPSSNTILSIDSMWEHSMAVGICAKKIAAAESDDLDIIDNSFIAGILHDIGKLVFLSKMAKKYTRVLELAQSDNISLTSAELKVFQATHSDVGAYLIGLWGLAGPVVEAIGFHNKLDLYPADSFSPALAVHVANVLVYTYRPETIISVNPTLNFGYIAAIGLMDRMENWQEICHDILEQTNDDK